MDKVFKIFVDFDGTITEQDVGEEIFLKFADKEKAKVIIDHLLNNKLSSRDCWLQLCNAVSSIDKRELDTFIDTMTMESSFTEFINYCSSERNELYILSDGFDYYINRIFAKNCISDILVYANKLELVDNKLIPGFPHFDESCNGSANCKRNHVINHSSDEDFTVFIGDGNSDKDVVQFCDFIFAKDDLLRHCEMERITFFPFNNFCDVIKKLNELKSKKRLKKRSRAQLNRQRAYTAE